MGIEIDRERFDDADYPRFSERLERCLEALGAAAGAAGFGVGPRTIGAELELFLIDDHGRPLARTRPSWPTPATPPDPGAGPVQPGGQPVAVGAGRPAADRAGPQLEGALASVRATARSHGGRVAMVGILPTLRDEDLHRGAITDVPRYRALDWSLRRVRAEPFEIEIRGRDPEPLRVVRDNIVMEGANTSFQVHLRVDPDDYVRSFNAAQLATAPVLAAAGNSPLFLHRVLWEETRIALFEQAADDRDTPGRQRLVSRVAFGTDWLRGSVLDLFEESVRHHEPLLPIRGDQDPLAALADGGVPRLDELRLHQGTVWRWNRAIYDSGYGGHLRIELRPLPAGPTVVDMLANAAFPARADPGPGPRRRGLDRTAAVRQGPRQLLRGGPPRPGGRASPGPARVATPSGSGPPSWCRGCSPRPARAGHRRGRRRRGRPPARGDRRPGGRRPDRRGLAAAGPGRPGGPGSVASRPWGRCWSATWSCRPAGAGPHLARGRLRGRPGGRPLDALVGWVMAWPR
jgi:hypothetical protein